jgi:hypothetical protein
MTLYLCTFRLATTQYMGETTISDKEFRLVKAPHPLEAEDKLERALGADRCEPGSDSKTLVDFEAFEVIE